MFWIEMGIAVLGCVLMGTSSATGQYDRDQVAVGGTMPGAGVFGALFIGAPMWSAGARFRACQPPERFAGRVFRGSR